VDVGEGIHENDMPTMSLSPSQLAAALQNADLLNEVGRLAITDELTGIYNRRFFFEMAEKEFTRAVRDKSHSRSCWWTLTILRILMTATDTW